VLLPDERFWDRILDEISACGVFVLVLSQFSAQSEWVEREILESRRLNQQVLPVRLDHSAVPWVLNGHNLVELATVQAQRPQIGVSRLSRHAPATLFGHEAELV